MGEIAMARLRSIVYLTASLASAHALRATGAAEPSASYAAWVGQYAEKSLGGSVLLVRLVDEKPRPNLNGFGRFGEPPIDTFTVGVDGSQDHTHSDSGGGRGGGAGATPEGAKLAAALRPLIAALPPDGGALPPAGCRLLIEGDAGNGRIVTAVYDRANLPDPVLDLLRRSKCGVGSDVPVVQPMADIEAADFQRIGCLTLMPDGDTLVFGGGGQATQWSALTREPLGDVPLRNVDWETFGVSPDGTRAFVGELLLDRAIDPQSWAVLRQFRERRIGPSIRTRSDPVFTPDGKLLLVRTTSDGKPTGERGRSTLEPGLVVYDTATWQAVAVPPFLPPDCVGYGPAKMRPLAVVERSAGGVVLWDVERRRAIAMLDTGSRLLAAAFSPDESIVAVGTAADVYGDGSRTGDRRLRLFEVAKGRVTAELWAADVNPVGSVGPAGTPYWSPDGSMVFSAVETAMSIGIDGIAAWDVRTGRQRAQLSINSNAGILGSAVLPASGEVVAGCADGHIRFWKMSAAAGRP
jgi:WD40 repeat protein